LPCQGVAPTNMAGVAAASETPDLSVCADHALGWRDLVLLAAVVGAGCTVWLWFALATRISLEDA